jgi:hypothetical protein
MRQHDHSHAVKHSIAHSQQILSMARKHGVTLVAEPRVCDHLAANLGGGDRGGRRVLQNHVCVTTCQNSLPDSVRHLRCSDQAAVCNTVSSAAALRQFSTVILRPRTSLKHHIQLPT